MFFEPPAATDRPDPTAFPDLPEWVAPSSLEMGVTLAVDRIVATSDHVVIVLPVIRTFRAGCLFDVKVVARRQNLSTTEWWDLRFSASPHGLIEPLEDGRIPDRLIRFGVRFSGGAKATTIDQHHGRATDGETVPEGPLLTCMPGGGGGRGRRSVFQEYALWLWPLPPPDTFEFAVEWPSGGIDLSIIEIDGAAIDSAVQHTRPYWPDS